MATTHELLSLRHWEGVPLAELVHRELAPFHNASNSRIDGPDVVLNAEAGQALAMMFHELVTNAAKLHSVGGERWPTCRAPARSGYGTSVVRELVPYELGGSVDLSEGVHCILRIPGHWLSANNRQEGI